MSITWVMTMFSGFISRWRIELSCIYFSPTHIYFNLSTVSAYVSFFFFFMREKRLPPSMYSIMIKKWVASSKNPYNLTILGWSKYIWILISLMNCYSMYFTFSLGTFLIATSIFVDLWSAGNTCPKAPSPLHLPN